MCFNVYFCAVDKRQEILNRSAEVFMKYGIKSVSMDELARELGMSKKTLYQHVKDKNDLVASIIKQRLDQDQDMCMSLIQESENAIGSLIKIITTIIETMSQIHPSVFYDLQKYHEDAWQHIENHEQEFVMQVLRRNVERGMNEGLYRNDIDPDLVAQLYVLVVDAVIKREINSTLRFEKVFVEVLHFFITGMCSEAGKKILNEQLDR